MKTYVPFLIAFLLAFVLLPSFAGAAGNKVTLMFESKYCRDYVKEVADALMAVRGVRSVDFNTLPGHAVVTTDGRVKEEALVTAINGVKGTKDGKAWACKAEVMKESGE